jgi:hypothetical protein
MSFHRLEVVLSLSLAVLTVVAFAPVNSCELVFYDDDFLGPPNPGVTAGLSWDGLKYAWTNLIGFWHPLTWMSLQLDSELYGAHSSGFHVTNLSLHVSCVLLLFWSLRRMTGQLWPSAWVAGLVALHPLNVEPVAWIAERRGMVCNFFWFLALAAYLRYAHRPAATSYCLVSLAMVFSLMAKATAMTLPAALLLLDYWPLRRMHLAWHHSPGSSPDPLFSGWRQLLVEKVPWVIIALVFAMITVIAEERAGALAWLPVPLVARLSNALVSYARYLGKAVWPLNLIPFYPHEGTSIPVGQVVAAGCLLVVLTTLVLRHANRRPYLATGWFWYLLTLLPVIGLVQVGRHGLADRYAYIPLIGIFMAVAWELAYIAQGRYAQIALSGLCTGSLAFCLALSWIQVHCWENNYTLWQHTLEVDPDNAVAHNSFGLALLTRGETAAAIDHFRAALKIDHNYADAHGNLGVALGRLGNKAETAEAVRLNAEAANEFAEAVRLNPADVRSHRYLAVVLERLGRFDEARKQMEQARQIESR